MHAACPKVFVSALTVPAIYFLTWLSMISSSVLSNRCKRQRVYKLNSRHQVKLQERLGNFHLQSSLFQYTAIYNCNFDADLHEYCQVFLDRML